MMLDKLVMYAVAFSMALGATDKVFLNNRLGLGEKFQEGFNKMGELAAVMFGMISLAPLLGSLLAPIVKPFYRILGADPAVFAGTVLANDMGGYPLAMELADSKMLGSFGGLVIGAMMGATIVFSIPVGLNMISEKDRPKFALGILLGIVVVPFGALVSGLLVGLPVNVILSNLTPVVVTSGLISLGLWRATYHTVQVFIIFSRLIIGIALLGAVVAGIQTLTGLTIVGNITPIEESFRIVGFITLVLLGAFPLMQILTVVFKKLLEKAGRSSGLDGSAVAGMVAAMANNIPMFSLFHQMNERGKVVSAAFCVSGSFVLGDHLAFTAANDSEFVVPVVVGKIVGGFLAIILALLVTKNYPISLAGDE